MADPAVAFVNKVRLLASALATKQEDPWILNELEKASNKVSSLPGAAKLMPYPQIKALQQPKSKRWLGWSAEQTLNELQERWPKTAEKVTTQLLNTIRNGLDECEDFKIKINEIEPLLRLASHLEEKPDAMTNSQVAAAWVTSAVMAMRAARCNVEDIEDSDGLAIREESCPVLLNATVDALKMVRDNNRAHSQMLRERLGDNIVPESPEMLWEMFGNTKDTDDARALYDAGCRMIILSLANAADKIDPELGYVIDILERVLQEDQEQEQE